MGGTRLSHQFLLFDCKGSLVDELQVGLATPERQKSDVTIHTLKGKSKSARTINREHFTEARWAVKVSCDFRETI